MVEILCQMLVEQDHRGRVGIRFHAHHAGIHATKKELATVNTLIEAMRATTALSTEPPIYASEPLALTNGKKPGRRKLKRGKTKCQQ